MNPQLGIPAFLALVVAGPARAAEGGLQLLPTGFAELWAQHGPSWAFLLNLWQLHQFLGLVVLFALLAPILNRFLFAPLLRVLEERDRQIAGARERAAQLATEADALLMRYDTAVRETRERAHEEHLRLTEDARNTSQTQVAEARTHVEEELKARRGELRSALDRAHSELRRDADALAREIAHRLLGREVA